MTENETKKNKKEPIYHAIDRVLLITLPMSVAMLILIIIGALHPLTALITFLITFFLTFFVSRPFLKELEVLIHYLKKEASGDETVPVPKFSKSRREAFRIVQAFNEIKMSWLVKTKILEAQTLSDGAILENLPLPLLMINEDGKIVQANKTAKELLGRLVVQKPLFKIFQEVDLEKLFKKALETGAVREDIDIVLKKKGHFTAVLERLPAKTKSGAVAVMLMNDVTAFKLFEENQRTFFANASHELRTPLSIFSGLIETMQGAAKSDTQAQANFLCMMREQTEHMTELVQDLLTLSRVGQKNEPLEMLSPSETLVNVCESLNLKASINQKKINLVIEEPIPDIQIRRYELFRLLQNLIDNAIKYGRKKTDVTVYLSYMPSPSKPVICLRVHNKGNPIPKEHLVHLCERFYRAPSDSYAISGTGLGLSIVQEIVQSNGGNLDIQSNAKAGTTFGITLPVPKESIM